MSRPTGGIVGGAVVRRVTRLVCRLTLRVLGVRVAVRGAIPAGPVLLVANHLGWLDILALLAHADCTFIAKREVRGWPLFGAMAARLGVVFVDRRRRRDLLRAIPDTVHALRAGRRVLLFAEGTTGDGRALLPFKSALVESAVRAGVPVVPVAIRAGARAGDLGALTWLGDETLVANIPRLRALRDAELRLHIAPALAPNAGRKVLTAHARAAIARRLPDGAIHRLPSVSRPRSRPRSRTSRAVTGALTSTAAAFIALLVGVSMLYAGAPRYTWPEPTRFAGAAWYNPYAAAQRAGHRWWQMNLHAHSAAWGGITHGRHSPTRVVDQYRALGYDIVGVSNYHRHPIHRPRGSFPVYEHGWNLAKAHQLVIGPSDVVWFDLPFGGGAQLQQYVIDRVRASGGLVALVHPALRGARTPDQLRRIGGYDLLEILNHFLPPADSLWDAALSSGHAVWLLAGDDSHDVAGRGETGTNFTMLQAADTSVDAVLEALRRGAAVGVRRDPAHVATREQLRLEGLTVEREMLRVQLSGALRAVRFVADSGRVVHAWTRSDRSTPLTDTVATWVVPLPASASYLRVVAEGDGHLLYTNPVVRWDGRALPMVSGTIDGPRTVLWRMQWSLLYAWGAVALFGIRRRGSPRAPVPVPLS